MQFAAIALFLGVIGLWAGAAQAAESPLSKRISIFRYYGNASVQSRAHLLSSGDPGGIPDAVTSLANHAEVTISVEALPPTEEIVPILIEARNETVGEVLGKMVSQDPRYEFRERFGVIEVLPVGADKDPKSCLNTVISEFRIHYAFNEAWGNVRCEIGILTGRVGWSARDPIGEPDPVTNQVCTPIGSRLFRGPPKQIEHTFIKTPLREIMTQLVSMAGNVAWTAEWKAVPRSCENLVSGLYQPRGWYPKDPDSPDAPKPEDWIEGLPATCTSCHYHEEQKRW